MQICPICLSWKTGFKKKKTYITLWRICKGLFTRNDIQPIIVKHCVNE